MKSSVIQKFLVKNSLIFGILLLLLITIIFYQSSNYENFQSIDNRLIPNTNDNICIRNIIKYKRNINDTWAGSDAGKTNCQVKPANSSYSLGANISWNYPAIESPTQEELKAAIKKKQKIILKCNTNYKWDGKDCILVPCTNPNQYNDNGNCIEKKNDNYLGCTSDESCKSGKCNNLRDGKRYFQGVMHDRCLFSKGNKSNNCGQSLSCASNNIDQFTCKCK